MATVFEVVNWAKDLANRGTGIDADGAFGMQCVDIPNAISQKFFGKALWGNAIDLLNSAAGAGYKVYRTGTPKAGAIFVSQIYSHPYGHTGIVIEDYNGGGYLRTIEQNVDGGRVELGGPARYRNTAMSDGTGRVIGWFYPPYSDLEKPASHVEVDSMGEEHMAMSFVFNIKGEPDKWHPDAMYFYNGSINEVQGIHNSEEMKYLAAIYKETTGRDLKIYGWSKEAPVYNRIFGVLKPGSQNAAILEALKKIQAEIDRAV